MDSDKRVKTVSVPEELFSSIIEAQKKWEEFGDALEDFLLSSDKEFLEKMSEARKEHIQGKVKDFEILKQALT